MTVGRDFCGTVISKGHGVENLNVDDEVYGFLPLHEQGSFSEIVLVDANYVSEAVLKPIHFENSSINIFDSSFFLGFTKTK